MSAYLVAFGIGSFASISALASTNTTVETFFPRCIPVRLFLHRVQRVRLHLRHHHREAESRVLFFLSRTLLPTSSSPAPPQPQLCRRRHGELRSAHLPRGVPAGVRQSRHAPPHRLRGRARDRAPMVRRRVDGRRLERRVPTRGLRDLAGVEIPSISSIDTTAWRGFAGECGTQGLSREGHWLTVGEAAAYYPFDVSPAATALKIEGLSGIQAVNSFSALSYTKVGQPRG